MLQKVILNKIEKNIRSKVVFFLGRGKGTLLMVVAQATKATTLLLPIFGLPHDNELLTYKAFGCPIGIRLMAHDNAKLMAPLTYSREVVARATKSNPPVLQKKSQRIS